MLIFSCETDTNLGYNILPKDDILDLSIIDTTSVNVYTLLMDSIATNGASTLLLGEYIDPIFGYSKASFVCEYGLVEFPDFTEYHTIDSAVLYLVKDTIDYYGNLNNGQNINVYKLENSLYDTSYFANHNPEDFLVGEVIGQQIYTPNIKDTAVAIRLNDDFANSFSILDHSTNNEAFKDFFKGVYITSETFENDGAILKFMINSKSLIKVYSHHNADNTNIYIFNATANLTTNIKFNLFEHDYSSTEFYNSIGDETLSQDSVAYIQAMGGLRTKILFPSLEKLKDLENVVINRAELVINTAPFNTDFPAIDRMLLKAYCPEDEEYLLPGYHILENIYLGVPYDDGSYKFDLNIYVQDILNGNVENNGLILFAGSGNSSMKRSIITTGSHSSRMKLVISYTKLK